VSARILVTGDRGYIGTVLTRELRARGYEIVGFDTCYFADCALEPTHETHRRLVKDIRDLSVGDLDGVEAIVHLAGLSNDPMGELAPHLTDDINLAATVSLGRLAKAVGVRRFVYASSQSMYGISGSQAELDEDDSDKNPITAYARTKWEAELALKRMNAPGFEVVCMRPSTVFGWSPRLRSDIVFNNLVACAFTTGRIEIKSDGTPWRPVIHIRDVCNAFVAGLEAPAAAVAGRSYNVGIENGNFTVRELAEAAQRAVPGSTLTFTGEHGSDSRTYRVSFKRILSELRQWYQPTWSLDAGAAELIEKFRKIGFTENQFRGCATIRLTQLRHLVDQNKINADTLKWTHGSEPITSN